MNYFRTVNPTEWSVPDFYHSYKAVFPAKKREDIVFAIRKDLDLLSKDDNAASAKAAKNLINGWQKLNFPSDAPSSESAQAEADNDTKLSQGNITFSNISGDVNLENTQYFNHDVQHHKRKIEDAAGSSQKRVASDSSVHQHSLLQSIPGADSFQVDSFHESNLDQYYGFEIWDMWSSFFYSSQENDELFMYRYEQSLNTRQR
ncbi:hypothetical protein BJV82DRAFT_92893 [Fennellomyces sp. T-0311]|nr:hypothetical protein BJV82DRAFT_92893 [Fennellomyces sp. T-0311]